MSATVGRFHAKIRPSYSWCAATLHHCLFFLAAFLFQDTTTTTTTYPQWHRRILALYAFFLTICTTYTQHSLYLSVCAHLSFYKRIIIAKNKDRYSKRRPTQSKTKSERNKRTRQFFKKKKFPNNNTYAGSFFPLSPAERGGQNQNNTTTPKINMTTTKTRKELLLETKKKEYNNGPIQRRPASQWRTLFWLPLCAILIYIFFSLFFFFMCSFVT